MLDEVLASQKVARAILESEESDTSWNQRERIHRMGRINELGLDSRKTVDRSFECDGDSYNVFLALNVVDVRRELTSGARLFVDYYPNDILKETRDRGQYLVGVYRWEMSGDIDTGKVKGVTITEKLNLGYKKQKSFVRKLDIDVAQEVYDNTLDHLLSLQDLS